MHARQVVALAAILDDELPVGAEFEAQAAAVTQEREVAIRPALGERAYVLGERRGASVEIDEHQLVPALAAHAAQTERNRVEGIAAQWPGPWKRGRRSRQPSRP